MARHRPVSRVLMDLGLYRDVAGLIEDEYELLALWDAMQKGSFVRQPDRAWCVSFGCGIADDACRNNGSYSGVRRRRYSSTPSAAMAEGVLSSTACAPGKRWQQTYRLYFKCYRNSILRMTGVNVHEDVPNIELQLKSDSPSHPDTGSFWVSTMDSSNTHGNQNGPTFHLYQEVTFLAFSEFAAWGSAGSRQQASMAV